MPEENKDGIDEAKKSDLDSKDVDNDALDDNESLDTPEEKNEDVLSEKINSLEAENENMKKRIESLGSNNQVSISNSDFNNMNVLQKTSYINAISDDEWELNYSKKFGSKSDVVMALHNQENAKLHARIYVNDKIGELISEKPKLSSVQKYIKEYFDNVPDADKLDNSKLNNHMKFAENYALGKYYSTKGTRSPSEKKVDAPSSDRINPNQEISQSASKSKVSDDVIGEYSIKDTITGKSVNIKRSLDDEGRAISVLVEKF
jgi:hypothetical protein